jgi:Tol biopolymer transport system component
MGMRRTVLLLASGVLVMLLSSGAALIAVLAVPKEAEAALPANNGWIAFTHFPQVGDSEIYKMLPDGSRYKQVTFNTTNDIRPAWSADGTRIALERYSRIFVKDIRTGQPVRLTSGFGEGPAWSPNDTKVIFSDYRDGDQEIYTMNSSDGSGLRKLTDNQNHDVSPVWSPDGTKIAFERDYDIWVMDADGTDQVNLTNSPSLSEYEPDWSPDGIKIAFTNGSWSDIFVMNADGSRQVNLTNTPSVNDDDPTWSPNGNKIAFESRGDLFKMNAADGSQQVNLTNTPESGEYLPDWQATPATSG